jgi:sugar phosphate isomerase/epimerase
MYKNLGIGELGHKAPLEESIELAKKHGFDGITFSIGDAQAVAGRESPAYLANLFRDANVLPGAWHFPLEFRKDEARWREDLDRLPDYAALAQELGCLRTFTYILPADDTRNFAENFRFHVERLRPAAQILNDYGCRFGLEFVGPATLRKGKRYSFLHTLEGIRALAASIGTSNVGILLDIFHLYTSHGRTVDIFELSPEEIVYVHVNDAVGGLEIDEQIDNVRALPGEIGTLDIGGFMSALETIGYDGPVSAEPFSQRVRDLSLQEAVAETAAAYERFWPASDYR